MQNLFGAAFLSNQANAKDDNVQCKPSEKEILSGAELSGLH